MVLLIVKFWLYSIRYGDNFEDFFSIGTNKKTKCAE